MIIHLPYTPTDKEIKFINDYVQEKELTCEISETEFKDIVIGDMVVMFLYDCGKTRDNGDPIGFQIDKCKSNDERGLSTSARPHFTTGFPGLYELFMIKNQ